MEISQQIRQAQGFTTELYESLKTEYLNRTDKTEQDLQNKLVELLKSNNDFGAAAKAVRDGLPALPLPLSNSAAVLSGFTPSFQAVAMALIADTANKERQMAAEMRYEKEQQVITDMMQQKKEIEKKATAQLVSGIVLGSLSIGAGAFSLGATIRGWSASNSAADQAKAGVLDQSFQLSANSSRMEVANKAYYATLERVSGYYNSYAKASDVLNQGFQSIGSSVSQHIQTNADAAIKESEAKAEQQRMAADTMKRLEDNLQALIQKAQSTMDAIQANMNQTRTRILG